MPGGILGAVDILIRRAEPAAFEAVWRHFQDESAYAGTLHTPYPSREAWRKRLAESAEGDYVLVACVGEEIVGHAGLHGVGKTPRRAHAMFIGMAVAPAWQGQGVGTALLGAIVDLADQWLNIFRLELTVFADNERALALYRQFGFEIEGTHRAYAAGHYVDAYAMARLRPKAPAVQ
ncbi:MAG TPA: GNAT family N-acetyltransferase [Usitatibacter sp.]|nr:GNAT family N-acetyltransferase [Usitatibacter sp.]